MVVVLLAVPALGMKTHSSNLETLPTSIPEVQTMRDLSAAFPSEGTTADLVVRGAGRAAGRGGGRPGRARGGRRRRPAGSASTGEPVAVSEDGRTSVLTLGIPFDESDDRVDSAIRELRADLAPPALDRLDVEYAVGGGAAESLDFVDRQQERLPLVIGFVLLLTLLIMAATFRSVPIAIVSAVLNLASVGVAFGMMTLVFQHGWFEGALDFTSPGFVIDWIPLFVLVVLVGLSMDYHVFVLSRVREHVKRGAADPARGSSGRRRDRRCRDQRRGGDGLGVLDLRDPVDARDEDDGRRALDRDPAGRDADPAGHAARRSSACWATGRGGPPAGPSRWGSGSSSSEPAYELGGAR